MLVNFLSATSSLCKSGRATLGVSVRARDDTSNALLVAVWEVNSLRRVHGVRMHPR